MMTIQEINAYLNDQIARGGPWKRPIIGPVWCLVGNLGGVRHVDAPGHGTRHFAHGTKLYCLPPYCGDGYETARVWGRSRGGRWIAIILATKKIVNWRAELVYSPTVIRLLCARSNRLGGHPIDLWDEERAKATAADRTVRLSRSASCKTSGSK